VLNDIVENVSANPELISKAQSLLYQVHFQFLCTLSAWNPILNHIDKTNQALQSKNVTVMQASKMLTGLRSTPIELRDALTDESFIFAKKIAEELEMPTSLPEKRDRKINRTSEEAVNKRQKSDRPARRRIYSIKYVFLCSYLEPKVYKPN
jgi:hypothetical protein